MAQGVASLKREAIMACLAAVPGAPLRLGAGGEPERERERERDRHAREALLNQPIACIPCSKQIQYTSKRGQALNPSRLLGVGWSRAHVIFSKRSAKTGMHFFLKPNSVEQIWGQLFSRRVKFSGPWRTCHIVCKICQLQNVLRH